MLEAIFDIILGILVVGILSLFMFIDSIHDYCKKHVDNIEDEKIDAD